MMTPKQIGKTISLPNRTANGPVALASPIETYRAINFAQTTAGVSATLPNATDATVYFGVDLTNSGTEALTINSVGALQPGKTLRAVWGTSGWNGQSILPRSFTHPNYTAGLNLWTPPIGVNAEDYGVMVFPQTSAGATLEFPNPSFTSSNVTMDMVNSGTQPITIVSATSATIMTLLAGKSQYMTWDGNSWNTAPTAELASSLIDTSAATQTVTLPAATGSGATKLYANKAITNTGTLAVASGEKLNGVVNGTFLFSNYPAGTQFIVTDYKTGEWVVSVEGAATQTSLTRIQASFTADPSFPTGLSDVAFNTIAFNGGIPMAAGVFSIKAGKTYRLVADLRSYNIASGSPEFYWVNATTNAELVPNVGHGRNFPPAGGSNATAKSRAEVVYTAPADMTVKVRIECGNTHSIERLQSVAIIEELPSTSAVLAGMVTPTSLTRIQANLTAAANLTFPADVPFNATAFNGGIAMAAGVFSLKAGKTYRLTANIRLNGTTGSPQFAWVNAVSNAQLVPNVGMFSADPSSQNAIAAGSDSAEIIYAAPSDMTVKLRWVSGGTTVTVEETSTSAIIEELPTSTVVMPETVPVVDLKYARYWQEGFNMASTAFSTGIGVRLAPLMSNDEGNMVSNGQDLIINQAGRYRFDWLLIADSGQLNDDGQVNLVVNGAIVKSVFYNMNQASAVNQTSGTLTADLALNDFVSVRYAGNPTSDTIIFEKGSYIQVQQIATQSVLNTASVDATDNTVFGYFDFGAMRMQWGLAINVNHDSIITLPAAFSNTSYTVVGTADNDTGNKTTVGLVTYGAKTTSSFQIGYVDSRDSTGGSNATISWFAIGRKP